jgi:hypothetical protein
MGGAALTALLMAGSAAAAPPPPAVARPGPSETAAILRGVRACANGVVAHDFFPKKFAADGWVPAGRKEVVMGGVPVQRLLYVRSAGGVLDSVLISRAGSVTCSTTARVASAAQVSEIREAVRSEFRAQSFAAYKGEEAFKAYISRTFPGREGDFLFSPGRTFSIEFMAGAGDPRVTIVVMPRSESR